MGKIKHDSIVVTSWDLSMLLTAQLRAVACGLAVTDIAGIGHNGYKSFLIAPDGSKEGWKESDRGDGGRALWIEWARKNDVNRCLEWIHVSLEERDVATIHDFAGRGEPEEEDK